MSATGRTPGLRERTDAYPTERYCVDRLLDRLALPGGRWLEPAAGEGDIIRAVCARRPDVAFDAVELRPTCRRLLEPIAANVTIGNWLAVPHELERYQVAMSNTPYREQLAERFLEQLLMRRELWIALLLPLGWLASSRRQQLHRAVPPDVYALPNRPIFRGSHGDQCDYGWFVYPPRTRRPRSAGQLQVLDLTDKEIRVTQRLHRKEWARSVAAPSARPARINALPKRVPPTFGRSATRAATATG